MNVATFKRYLIKYTNDFTSILELGCMFGGKLMLINPNITTRIGIEIHQPYLDKAVCDKSVQLICGDMRKYRELLIKPYPELVMFIDTLEHLEKCDAIKLIEQCKEDFKRIILFVPSGVHNQNKDPFNLGGDEHQTHKSTWYYQEIMNLGFQYIEEWPEFHGAKGGALWAVWDSK